MIEAKRLGREVDVVSDKTYKKYKDMRRNSITYYGADWEYKSVGNEIYGKFNHFIFIDALPKLSHYEPGMSGYNEAMGYNLKLISNNGNLLTFKNEKIKLEYYINTTVEEVLLNPNIKKKKSILLREDCFLSGLKVGEL